MLPYAGIDYFNSGIYEIQEKDPVEGGYDGLDNAPHTALANRTIQLKNKIAALRQRVADVDGGQAAQNALLAAIEAEIDAYLIRFQHGTGYILNKHIQVGMAYEAIPSTRIAVFGGDEYLANVYAVLDGFEAIYDPLYPPVTGRSILYRNSLEDVFELDLEGVFSWDGTLATIKYRNAYSPYVPGNPSGQQVVHYTYIYEYTPGVYRISISTTLPAECIPLHQIIVPPYHSQLDLDGCTVNDLRNIGIPTNTASTIYVDGKLHTVLGNVVSIPENESGADITYYAYVDLDGDVYRMFLEETQPITAIPLYEITVPNNHTGQDLSGITVTDKRVIQNDSDLFVSAASEVDVPLIANVDNAPDYDIQVTPISANDLNDIDFMEVTNKQNDQFTVKVYGPTSDISFRWRMINPNMVTP